MFLNIELDASLIIFFFNIRRPFIFPFELPYEIVPIWQLIYFQVRHRLRKDYGIEGGIPVVFSLEKPKVKLLPFKGSNGEEDNPADYQVRMLACYFKVLLCLLFSIHDGALVPKSFKRKFSSLMVLLSELLYIWEGFLILRISYFIATTMRILIKKMLVVQLRNLVFDILTLEH